MSIPSDVRAAVLRRAEGGCEDCRVDYPLELHHLRYFTDLGEPIDGIEEEDDLAALCRECHHDRHIDPNGVFWRDPEEMEDAWFGFHWEMEKP